jgi:DNA-binding NtrC family response regulator
MAASRANVASVLLAEDDDMRPVIAQRLRDRGLDVTAVGDGKEAIAALAERSYDILITDWMMPGADGLAVLRQAHRIAPQTLVVVTTGFATTDRAIHALREGAVDFMVKPIRVHELEVKIEQLLERRALLWEGQAARRQAAVARESSTQLIGESAPMCRIKSLIDLVAKGDSTVLITGESGVGKEVVARAIHDAGHLRDQVFLPVNCAAIPDQLLESELFGHRKGSFTGADSTQDGLFRKANGGTLFLDEIGEMPLYLQAKLLRAIESKEILPIGSGSPVSVRVRIIACTNRDLRSAVQEKRFREDLFYRLNVIRVDVPALRERRDDIPQLARFLVDRHNRVLRRAYHGVERAALIRLIEHSWPGNVRELDHTLEYAMTVGDGEWVRLRDLPSSFADDPGDASECGEGLLAAVRRVERIHIEGVLRLFANDPDSAARRLGIHRSTLYRKIKELNIKLLDVKPPLLVGAACFAESLVKLATSWVGLVV